jgi:hypothetical protein
MFDVKVEPVEPEPPSTSIGTEDQDVLEDYPGDLTAAELREVIDDLNDDEVSISSHWRGSVEVITAVKNGWRHGRWPWSATGSTPRAISWACPRLAII